MSNLKGVALFAALCSPLLLTSTLSEPSLTAVGIALQVWLARITTIKPSPAITTSVEQANLSLARSSLVTTSATNRSTRAALGLLHVAAAFAMGARGQGKSDATMLSRAIKQCMNSAGIFALCSVGTMWMSSGYYGQ